MTSPLPKAAHSQNPVDGRWRCSQAPTAAVASGKTPTMTLACTASTWRIATEVNKGNPNTTPPEVMASGNQSSRRGNGARVSTSRIVDKPAATTARPSAMKTPDICGASGVPTASRVIGSVKAKMVTPSRPSHSPLLLSVMESRSRSAARLLQSGQLLQPGAAPAACQICLPASTWH